MSKGSALLEIRWAWAWAGCAWMRCALSRVWLAGARLAPPSANAAGRPPACRASGDARRARRACDGCLRCAGTAAGPTSLGRWRGSGRMPTLRRCARLRRLLPGRLPGRPPRARGLAMAGGGVHPWQGSLSWRCLGVLQIAEATGHQVFWYGLNIEVRPCLKLCMLHLGAPQAAHLVPSLAPRRAPRPPWPCRQAALAACDLPPPARRSLLRIHMPWRRLPQDPALSKPSQLEAARPAREGSSGQLKEARDRHVLLPFDALQAMLLQIAAAGRRRDAHLRQRGSGEHYAELLPGGQLHAVAAAAAGADGRDGTQAAAAGVLALLGGGPDRRWWPWGLLVAVGAAMAAAVVRMRGAAPAGASGLLSSGRTPHQF